MIERPVPLMQIGEYTSMRIAQPPPFRDRLTVELDVLTEALKVANIDTQAIAVRFIPREYIREADPVGYWQFNYRSREVGTAKRFVTLKPDGELEWNIQYEESALVSAFHTAQFASHRFRYAMFVSPLILVGESSLRDVLTRNLLPAYRFLSFQKTVPSFVIATG